MTLETKITQIQDIFHFPIFKQIPVHKIDIKKRKMKYVSTVMNKARTYVRTVYGFKYITGCEGGMWSIESFGFLNRKKSYFIELN